MPFPAFYDPANADKWDYTPNQSRIFNDAMAYASAKNIKASSTDKRRVALVLIDDQKDFCIPPKFDATGQHVGGGALYVAGRSGDGSVQDSRRTAEFVYNNLERITEVHVTMDTHFQKQIFFSSFWVDGSGNAVPPYTAITLDDFNSGKYQLHPSVAGLCGGNYSWAMKQARFYMEELARAGKYTLYLWPFHCMLGSPGHALVGVIDEATQFHAWARGTNRGAEVKGTNPWVEHYSVFSPECTMRHDGKPLDQRNTKFIETLLTHDYVVIGGQAASHCTRASVDDFLTEIHAKDPRLVEKVYVLTDCMSPVVVPGLVDYTDETEKAFQEFANRGMKLVKSTTPMADWDGMVL